MKHSAPILVCDDDELIRWSISEFLRNRGYSTLEATNGDEALSVVQSEAVSLVLMDLKMPVKDGMAVLRELRAAENDVPVVVLTAYGGVSSAIEATRLGANDYLTKPCDLEVVLETVEKTLEAHRLRSEVQGIDGADEGRYHSLIGRAPAMTRVFDRLQRLETIDAPTVMVMGESGTGKDLVARSIHARGPRRDAPFMEVDCTAIPETLFESTLFGHERGAFTDAKSQHRGLFESARGGVVFLDEIGEMSLQMQAKLLRALENRRFKRVGGTQDIHLDAAIIVATNRDLRHEVEAGRFREDLYYRLAVVMINVPPLRERPEDISLLVNHFLRHFGSTFGREINGVSEEAMDLLRSYRWPGNVRELRNVTERTTIFLEHDVVTASDLPAEVRLNRGTSSTPDCPFVLPDVGIDLESTERGLIAQALERTSGNQSAAARLLGLSRYALRYRMEKHGIRLLEGGGVVIEAPEAG